MDNKRSEKVLGIIFILLLWVVIVWLVYPLFTLRSIDINYAKEYIYRSAAGIAIMIILFGKTVFDLFFNRAVTRKKQWLNTILLTLYSMGIAGAIIYMVARVVVLYINSQDVGDIF